MGDLSDAQGQAQSFRLIACEGSQISSVSPLVSGAGQGGTSLATVGWGASGTKLTAGQFVTIGEQLLQLTQDVIADSGAAATLHFLPYIRIPPADNAAIIVDRPTALMCMSQDDNGWTVGRGQQYAIGFNCEEAF